MRTASLLRDNVGSSSLVEVDLGILVASPIGARASLCPPQYLNQMLGTIKHFNVL